MAPRCRQPGNSSLRLKQISVHLRAGFLIALLCKKEHALFGTYDLQRTRAYIQPFAHEFDLASDQKLGAPVGRTRFPTVLCSFDFTPVGYAKGKRVNLHSVVPSVSSLALTLTSLSDTHNLLTI